MSIPATTLPGDQLALMMSVDACGAAPQEFRIFANGVNETTKGPIVFNERAGASILADLAELGRDQLNFDYGHGQVGILQTAESAMSAGWFTVEVRQDGLWATNIQWTPRAARALSDREFRYFSPVVFVDPETNEARRLVNIALTNIPATKRQEPLVASEDIPITEPKEPATVDPELAKLLGAFGVQNATQALAKFDQSRNSETKLAAAVQAAQTELASAKAELDQIKAEKAAAEKAAFVEKLSADGKLAPALKEWALSQSLETLQAYSASAPSVTPGAGVQAPAESRALSANDLDPDEKHMARLLGVSLSDYLAERKDINAVGKDFWIADPSEKDSE